MIRRECEAVTSPEMCRRALVAILVCAGFLSACGSSHPASVGGAPSNGSIPSVSNATNLHVEPVVSASSGTPPTSLMTRDLIVGTGATAVASNTVLVQYVGANYSDGKDFDSSWQRGQAATFPLSGVVPGFAQGIVGMKVGGRREIVIPPALGYGAAGYPPAVSANETLVFVVDLISIH
jgi:peptidylprolyl isomerase